MFRPPCLTTLCRPRWPLHCMESFLINSAVVKRASVRRTRPRLAGPVVLVLLALVAGSAGAQTSAPLPEARPTAAPPTSVVAANGKSRPDASPQNSVSHAVPLPLPKPSSRPTWSVPSKLASTYQPAFQLAEQAKWSKLARLRRNPGNPLLETVLDGLRLADPRSKAEFSEITAFLEAIRSGRAGPGCSNGQNRRLTKASPPWRG